MLYCSRCNSKVKAIVKLSAVTELSVSVVDGRINKIATSVSKILETDRNITGYYCGNCGTASPSTLRLKCEVTGDYISPKDAVVLTSNKVLTTKSVLTNEVSYSCGRGFIIHKNQVESLATQLKLDKNEYTVTDVTL